MDKSQRSKKLLNLKEQIERAKSGKLRTEGRVESLMETLLRDYKCKTVEAAEEKLGALIQRRENLEGKLEKGLRVIENERADD